MTYSEILNNLKKQIYHPVYLLTGEESYYIDLLTDFFELNILNETEREFNLHILYGKDTNISAVLSNCKRYPMMASHVVLIVREAQDIGSFEGLDLYLENPPKSTILVLCYKNKKFDLRTKAGKKIKEKGVFFDSPKIYDNKIPDWITAYLKERSFSISPKIGLLLSEYLGNNLRKIANELDKMLLNLKSGSEINEDTIERHIGISKDYNIFELQDAIAENNILKANMIVYYFIANLKENPLLKIIPILYQYFIKIMKLHQLADKSPQSIASALGVSPFFTKDYIKAAKNLSFQKLAENISILREYDMRIKGIDNESTSEGELMKEMIYKIMH